MFGFCKLKLKRFGSLERLHEGLLRVRACGMEPVLGDGLGSEVQSWLEACVARKHNPQRRRVQRLPEAKGSAAAIRL